MASVFRRTRWVTADGHRVSEQEAALLLARGEPVERREGKSWYLRFLDERGRRKDQRSRAKTKTEAQRLADDLERRAERIRNGLEVGLPADGGGTLAELLEWWLKTCRAGTPSYATESATVKKHLTSSPAAQLPLTQVHTATLEQILHDASKTLAAQTVNHLRGYLVRAFNAARRLGR